VNTDRLKTIHRMVSKNVENRRNLPEQKYNATTPIDDRSRLYANRFPENLGPLAKAVGLHAHLSSLSLFKKIPSTLLTYKILPYLNLESEKNFRDAQALGRLNKDPLCKLFNTYLQTDLFKTFIQEVAYGNKFFIKSVLEQSSPNLLKKLLLSEDTVIDYSGRKIRGTPLRIALGAMDVNLRGNNSRLAQYSNRTSEIIVHYLNTLPNGRREIEKQVNSQFPDEESKEGNISKGKSCLDHIVSIMALPQSTDHEWELSLELLKEYLNPKGVIEVGFHTDSLQVLSYAIKIWYKLFDSCNDVNKREFFLIRVLGYIQRYLTASDAQAFCEGFTEVIKHDSTPWNLIYKQYDEMEKRNRVVNQFFPLDADPSNRLGYEIVFRLDHGPCTPSMHYRGLFTHEKDKYFDKYVKMKTQLVKKYISSLRGKERTCWFGCR